jgi:3-dehydroquinate synthase
VTTRGRARVTGAAGATTATGVPPERVRVDLGPRSYDVVVGAGILSGLGTALRELGGGRRALLVADSGVAASYGATVGEALRAAGLEVLAATVPAGERSKSLRQAERLYDAAIAGGCDRGSWVVAVGGGVVGDLAGFLAATLFRGVALCQVPTTLLALVDSSVGGKVAVNHRLGKNLIGAFHQPRLCWGDVATLATLPRRELRCGLAEVVKHGVMADARYLDEVERAVPRLLARDPQALAAAVAGSVRIKAAVVAGDEREESGARQCLNLGHTVGQALEAVAGYGRLHHGEAVAVGLVAAGEIALRQGLWSPAEQARLVRLLRAIGLPTRLPAGTSLEALLAAMVRDKKTRDGQLRWVLPVRTGEVAVGQSVPEATVRAVLADMEAVA